MDILKIIFDVVLVLVIGFSVFWGYKRGFVKSFFQSTKLLLVVLVTLIIGSMLVSLCQDMFVNDMFDGKITDKIVERAERVEGQLTFDSVEDEIPTIVKNIIPMATLEQHFSTLSGDNATVAKGIGEAIETVLVDIVSNVIGYVLAFIIAFITCSIVIWLLDKFFKLPVFNWVNRIAGIIWGIVSAYLTTSTLAVIIALIFGNEFVYGTIVTKFIYSIGLFSF